jgi:hypothetical protein
MPVSSLMAGSRMLTADVFAFTTSVAIQVAARTPLALVPGSCCAKADAVILGTPPVPRDKHDPARKGILHAG